MPHFILCTSSTGMKADPFVYLFPALEGTDVTTCKFEFITVGLTFTAFALILFAVYLASLLLVKFKSLNDTYKFTWCARIMKSFIFPCNPSIHWALVLAVNDTLQHDAVNQGCCQLLLIVMITFLGKCKPSTCIRINCLDLMPLQKVHLWSRQVGVCCWGSRVGGYRNADENNICKCLETAHELGCSFVFVIKKWKNMLHAVGDDTHIERLRLTSQTVKHPQHSVIFRFAHSKTARQESSKFYSDLRNASSLALTKYYSINFRSSSYLNVGFRPWPVAGPCCWSTSRVLPPWGEWITQ